MVRRILATAIGLAAGWWAASAVSQEEGVPSLDSELGGSAGSAQRVTVEKTAWSESAVHPGGQITLAVVLDVRKPYHINPNDPPEDHLIPTRVWVEEPPANITVGKPQYPEPKQVKVGYLQDATTTPAYQGRTVVYIPMTVSTERSTGAVSLNVKAKWQACDERMCYKPNQAERRLELKVVGSSTEVASQNKALFEGFDPSVFATGDLAEQTTPEGETAGGAEGEPTAAFGFLGVRFDLTGTGPLVTSLLLLIAVAAGALLNFTPCVLPVVPLKIMSLQQQAGKPARCMALGASFAAGIVACFGVLGLLAFGLIAGVQRIQWGQQFSNPWFTITLGVIVGVMGLGLFGLFTPRLPKGVYKWTPSNETHKGSFLFGILTAVLSTPCTGPLLGGTLAWSVSQPPWLGVSTFLVMGVGMALPYLLLTLNPRWIHRLPRTGPGSELIKQVMGGLLIAVALYFFGIAGKGLGLWGDGFWWAVAAAITVTMVWLIGRTWQITARTVMRATVGLVAVAIIGTGWWASAGLARPSGIGWRDYSPTTLEKARDAGKTVVLEFTAEWCPNCKTLERTVLQSERVRRVLARPDVVPIRVDLTSQANKQGWKKLRELGSTGIPLTAVYRPGKEEPVRLTSIYTPDALIRAVRGG